MLAEKVAFFSFFVKIICARITNAFNPYPQHSFDEPCKKSMMAASGRMWETFFHGDP